MSVQYGNIFGSFSKLAFEALICSQAHLQWQFREHDKKTGLGGGPSPSPSSRRPFQGPGCPPPPASHEV